MGVYTGRRLHEWGDPIALLKFPGLSPIEKARYGLMMFMATAPPFGRSFAGIRFGQAMDQILVRAESL